MQRTKDIAWRPAGKARQEGRRDGPLASLTASIPIASTGTETPANSPSGWALRGTQNGPGGDADHQVASDDLEQEPGPPPSRDALPRGSLPSRRGPLHERRYPALDGGVADAHQRGARQHAQRAPRLAALDEEREGGACDGDDRRIALDPPQGGIGFSRRRPHHRDLQASPPVIIIEVAVVGAVAASPARPDCGGLRHGRCAGCDVRVGYACDTIR